MTTQTLTHQGKTIALVTAVQQPVSTVTAALDLMMSLHYHSGASRIAIAKECLNEDFFILSTGLAGEILQKFINYKMKVAIYGDYAKYTSKPLKDFIYESNKGRDIFFTATKEEALDRLAAAQD